MSTFEAKVGMSDLQAEHGRNVFGALVEGGPMLSTDPSHAKLWELSWDGSDAGSSGSMCSSWVENRSPLAPCGPVPRNHFVLELCGMDFAITVQVKHAMFGRDQDFCTGSMS